MAVAMGLSYWNGKGGLGKDSKRAVELFQKACDGGDMDGCSISSASATRTARAGWARTRSAPWNSSRRPATAATCERLPRDLGSSYENGQGRAGQGLEARRGPLSEGLRRRRHAWLQLPRRHVLKTARVGSARTGCALANCARMLAGVVMNSAARICVV
jgi:hypothetical protein